MMKLFSEVCNAHVVRGHKILPSSEGGSKFYQVHIMWDCPSLQAIKPKPLSTTFAQPPPGL